MNAKHLACAVLVLVLASTYPAVARAGFDVGVTVGFAPPPLPVYVQPPCPSPGYVWAPGYWAYGDDDYYWVPGTWVLAPEFGLLWTPGYWSVVDDYFVWQAGYWAPHVGFYGGINYGFGYFGTGFVGGYWRDHDFFYNRAVTNITNVNFTNVYNSRVYNDRTVNNSAAETRVSYNGGNGVHARPTRAELAASHEARRGLTPSQRRQVESAQTLRTLRASVNHGVPPVAATNRPGVFAARGVVAARQNVSDSRPFHSPPRHAVTRSVDPVRTSAHIAAAPQASRTPQPITHSRNPASVPRVAAQAPAGHTFNQPAASSQYTRNLPPSARSFPVQAPDRRGAASAAPHGNATSGANFRPAREAQPAHANVPSPPRNGRHS
jgi:WXXGXW repeat (2 copies)